MMASPLHQQIVQVLEVIVVTSNQDTSVPDSVRKVKRISSASQIRLDGQDNVVSCLRQKPGQERRRGIIVEIEPHDRRSLARSCGIGYGFLYGFDGQLVFRRYLLRGQRLL